MMLSSSFFLNSLLAGLLASIASGVIGSYVVVKRILFISGGIAHSVLGGIGLCVWLKATYSLPWLDPLYGAFFSALLSAGLIGWIHLHYRHRQDTAIAAIWATGMALGVIFISITPGSGTDLMNFLFGNISWITSTDLILLLLLDFVLIGVVCFFYTRLLAICFDEEQALLQGISVHAFYYLLLCLVGIGIVLLIQVIGTILMIALLALPATIASLFSHRLFILMLIAVALSIVLNFLGILLSYQLNWPSGATIALCATLAYGLALSIKKKIST